MEKLFLQSLVFLLLSFNCPFCFAQENLKEVETYIGGQSNGSLFSLQQISVGDCKEDEYKIIKEQKNKEAGLTYKEQYDLCADNEQVETIKLKKIQMKYDNQELTHRKELLEINKQYDKLILDCIIVFVIVLLFFIISLYKVKEGEKQKKILLQHQIRENESFLFTLQCHCAKRNKEIETLSIRHERSYEALLMEKKLVEQELWELQQRNKELEELFLQYKRSYETLLMENGGVKQQLWEMRQKNEEENVEFVKKNRLLQKELEKYKDIKAESGRYYETITFIINLLDNPETAHNLTLEEFNAIECLVSRLFSPMFQSRVEAVGLSTTEKKMWCLLQLGFSHASIATFLCITPRSVSTAKFRIRKKIQEFMANNIEKLYL